MSKTKLGRPSKDPEYNTAFVRRLKQACDNNRNIPADRGRLAWIVRQMKIFGEDVSIQTVSRWYKGDATPSPARMKVLAEVLRVDEGTLYAGAHDPDVSMNAAVHGSLNLVMGLFQIAGWQCAIPETADADANLVHFYGIRGGKQKRFYVTQTSAANDKVEIAIPSIHRDSTVIGVVASGETDLEVLAIPTEMVNGAPAKRSGASLLTLSKKGAHWVDDDDLKALVIAEVSNRVSSI